MRAAIKARRPGAKDAAHSPLEQVHLYPAVTLPNSSAILTLTMLANLEEVLALLRTAALVARSFRTQLCVELPEKETLVIDPDEHHDASQLGFLDSAQIYLKQPTFSASQEFVLETNFTAATFLSAGNISVQIRLAKSVSK